MYRLEWEFLDNLFEAIGALPDAPQDVTAYVAGAPAVGTLPPPWVTWALLHLFYLQSQIHRLEPPRSRSGKKRTTGCPAARRERPVPPGWVCRQEGNRTAYRHKATGETVWLNDSEGPREPTIGVFLEHTVSFTDPPPVVVRHRTLTPSVLGVVPALYWMRGCMAIELLKGGDDDSDFLTGEYRDRVIDLTYYEDRCGVVARFLERWGRSVDRLWLAAGIGDWLAAHDEAVRVGLSELIELTGTRAEECRRGWTKYLDKRLSETIPTPEVLLALVDVGRGSGVDALGGYTAKVADQVIDRLLVMPAEYRGHAHEFAVRYSPGRLAEVERETP